MKKLGSILLILVISASFLKGQSAVFSQFDNNPLFVNPTMTGDFDGRLRFNGTYSNQYANVFSDNSWRLYSLSVETHLCLAQNIDLGIGLSG